MANPSPINFMRGVPADESYPISELADAATAVLGERGVAMLSYGPARGFAPLCEWLARWQDVAPERVLTANGSLQIVELLCHTMIVRSYVGDSVKTTSTGRSPSSGAIAPSWWAS